MPHKDKTQRRLYLKRKRAEWKAAGICYNCGNNLAVMGDVFCQKCKDKQYGYYKNRRERDEKDKRCIRCRQAEANGGCLYCDTCRKDNQAKLLQQRYNITMDEYERMVAAQNNCCAICRRHPGKRILCVDHNHDTGEVRQLLCHRCNKALGLFGDDADILLSAVDYLQKHKLLKEVGTRNGQVRS